ncbi:ABC transporter permease [Butyrivibrio sp. AC2005]|uniref:ABC transporter permease n=1 Tax=Butyrivibrio sp. AC2005 TaxID=1280672 RepID=UPI00047B34FE|nr:FtsX-like permease family protein [Butyrivibrio sp. AC2005]
MILLRKVLRDLKQNAGQFLAIYIMTLLSLLIQSGFESSNVGATRTASDYFTMTNYKDLNIEGIAFTYHDIDMLNNYEGVNNVDGILRGTGKISLDKERLLVLNYIGSNNVSKMYLTDGEKYTPGSTGCWVEKRFADPMGIRVGDTLTFTSGNYTLHEQVKGLIYSPEFLYYIPNATYTEPEYGTHGFIIMDINENPNGRIGFDKLIVDLKDVTHNSYLLTDEEKATMNAMRSKIEHKFDNPNLLIKTKIEDEDYADYAGSMDSNNAISTIFPLMFLAVAMLGIITTMTRLTDKQRVQIGTLKALGFSRGKIMFHYMSYSVIIASLGCLSGIIIGPITLGAYLNGINEYYYQNPLQNLQLTVKTLYMSFATIGLCMLVTYLTTRKLLVQSAARILQAEAPKFDSASIFEKTILWNSLKFATRWNIRDVRRNKLRTAVSIVGILVCSMLIFMALGFFECLATQSEWMYGDIFRANGQISFKDGTPYGTVYEYAKEYDGQLIQDIQVTLFTDSAESVRGMTVLDDGNLFMMENVDLEYTDLPENGIILTSRLYDYLGIEVGQTLRWKIPGSSKVFSAPIVKKGRIASGQGIIMSRKVWEDLGGEFMPNYVYTNKTVPPSLKSRTEIDSIDTKEKLIETLENSNEISYYISYIIIAIAIVMGVVVLYNLGVLSYVEKTREIATLKVLGFRSGDIRLILLQQSLAITVVGAMLGVPFGRIMLDILVDVVAGIYRDMVINPSAMPYIGAIVGTFMVSVLVNLYVSSKVYSINMVDALKSRE